MLANSLPQIKFSDQRKVSKIALGCMGLTGTWNPDEVTQEKIQKAIQVLEAAYQLGIHVYDHADIYGGTTCESAFGELMKLFPEIRKKIFISTKCGILLPDQQGPKRYDLTSDYIKRSVEASLNRLHVEYIDLFQIHRPDPYSHPKETAKALTDLVEQGYVRGIGVSNYTPSQFLALEAYLDIPLLSNQVPFSLRNKDIFYNGVLDQCYEKNVRILAYSPLGKGTLSGNKTNELTELAPAFERLGNKYSATPAQLSLAWIMQHPAGIIPLLGSTNPDHLKEAVKACELELSREDWFLLLEASRGVPVP